MRQPARYRTRAIGGAVAVALVAFLALVFSGAANRLLNPEPPRVVRAEVATSQQLKLGDPVRIHGVDVGRVQNITRLHDRIGALVTMRIDNDAGAIYADARATIRTKTILGGAFAVSLDRGTAAAGPLRGTIPMDHTTGQVEVEDLLDVTGGQARRGMQRLPAALGHAFQDPHALTGALGAIRDASPSVRRGVGALRGVDQDRDLRQFVKASAATVRALDAPGDPLGSVISHGGRVLQTVAGRDAELKTILGGLPGGLAELRSTSGALDTTLALANPVLRRVDAVAAHVAPSVRRLHGTVSQANTLLASARPLLAQLRPAARSLARTSANGLPLLQALLPSLDRIDHTLLPMLGEKDPVTEKPLGTMIGGWGAALGSGAAGGIDGNGRFVRFPATAGSSSFYLPCQTYVNNPDHASVVECQDLQTALNTLLGAKAVAREGSRR